MNTWSKTNAFLMYVLQKSENKNAFKLMSKAFNVLIMHAHEIVKIYIAAFVLETEVYVNTVGQ
jgi:hypothetical protein